MDARRPPAYAGGRSGEGDAMRGRKRLWVLVGLAAVLLAVGAFMAGPPPPDRVTRANFDRVWEGMSRAEVEAILGPPGDYTTGPGEIPTWAELGVGNRPPA